MQVQEKLENLLNKYKPYYREIRTLLLMSGPPVPTYMQ